MELIVSRLETASLPDYGVRWIAVAFTGLLALVSLRWLNVAIDWHSEIVFVEGIANLLVFILALCAFRRMVPRFAHCTEIPIDLLLSIIQAATLVQVVLPLSYVAVAAGAHFALIDSTLSRLDWVLFRFNWDAVSTWFTARPEMQWVLRLAYSSILEQALGLLLIGSILRPDDRNREFFWIFFVASTLMLIISPFTPATGKVGLLHYLNLLSQIRAGEWHVFSWRGGEGLVTFPSFHTTLAIVFLYIAFRLHRLAFAAYAPLNAVMLVSIPPIGGHYLMDMVGGAAVAVVAIVVVRLIPRVGSLPDIADFPLHGEARLPGSF